jgi:hypothetical protein
MRGGLLVCGTGSDAGTSFVVAGLCRLTHRGSSERTSLSTTPCYLLVSDQAGWEELRS